MIYWYNRDEFQVNLNERSQTQRTPTIRSHLCNMLETVNSSVVAKISGCLGNQGAESGQREERRRDTWKRLGIVRSFSWLGWFREWIYMSPVIFNYLSLGSSFALSKIECRSKTKMKYSLIITDSCQNSGYEPTHKFLNVKIPKLFGF